MKNIQSLQYVTYIVHIKLTDQLNKTSKTSWNSGTVGEEVKAERGEGKGGRKGVGKSEWMAEGGKCKG